MRIMSRFKPLKIISISFFSFSLAWLPAEAFQVKNLYEVRMISDNQLRAERQRLTEGAFRELLIRITGKTDIAKTLEGEALLGKAAQYVSQFRYEKEQLDPLPPAFQTSLLALSPSSQAEDVLDEEPSRPTVLPVRYQDVLVVLFDEKAVKEALWEKRLPVWGNTRPTTLVWLGFQDAQGRYLLDASEDTEILRSLRKYSKKRGLPLVFPLLDLEDQINININDVWGDFREPIVNASMRYQTEAVLAARVFLDSFGVWQGRWSLYQGDEATSWRTRGRSVESLISAGLSQSAETLALKYANISADDDAVTGIKVQITDVSTLQDFVKLDKYLLSLSTVSATHISEVHANNVIFDIELRSDSSGFEKAVSLGKMLIKNHEAFFSPVDERLSFRLIP